MFFKEAYTDWIRSKNYFVNVRTAQISDNFNEVLDLNHVIFHPEGLCNYLEYGYSVFGQTIVDEIKILEPNMHAYVDSNGKLVIEKVDDPFEKLLGKQSNATDALEYMQFVINEWVDSQEKEIIVPTSGGFDSRLLNSLIQNKEKVKAYSYGISTNQDESYESVYASKLCEILGIPWEQIYLSEYEKYINEWEALYGCSTHAHGMYQMEFYKKISNKSKGSVLSGFLGDGWAGNWRIEEVESPTELRKLTRTYGAFSDSTSCKLKCRHELRDKYWEENKYKMKDENWRILEGLRNKTVLLSYLLRVPEHEGFDVWTPFLDINVVEKIINLDWREKERRKWEVDYFREKGLLIGELNLKCDKDNCLDSYACHVAPPKPLDRKVMSELFDISYIDEVNKELEKASRGKYLNSATKDMKGYYTYLVLHPIESLLKSMHG